MNWITIGASVIGSSHTAAGAQCEDSCWTGIVESVARGPILGMFVSDGAGSADRGGEGADLAVQTAARFFQSSFEGGSAKEPADRRLELDESWALELVSEVRAVIEQAAEAAGCRVRDFAATFLALVASSGRALAIQVGDGGIVWDVGDGLELALESQGGEYLNETYFVTDEDAHERVAIRLAEGRATQAALFTDGLERLAVQLDGGVPHGPFFAPLFDQLGSCTSETEDEFVAKLVEWLGSDAINERTDDDKTLALAREATTT